MSEKNVAIQRNMIVTVVADDPLTGTGVAVCLAAITIPYAQLFHELHVHTARLLVGVPCA